MSLRWLWIFVLWSAFRSAGAAETAAAVPSSAPAADGRDAVRLLLLTPSRPLRIDLWITIDGRSLAEAWQARFAELVAAEHLPPDGADASQTQRLADSLSGRFGANWADVGAELKQELSADHPRLDRPALQKFLLAAAPMLSIAWPGEESSDGSELFDIADQNHDQALSSDELQALGPRLLARDFNDDHLIDAAELRGALSPSDSMAMPRRRRPALVWLSPDCNPDELADRILQRYDRNRDGVLTTQGVPPEITEMPGALGGLDRDQDRQFDRAELAAILSVPAELQLPMRFGKVAAATRLGPVQASRLPFRRKIDGGARLQVDGTQIDIHRNGWQPVEGYLRYLNFPTLDQDDNGTLDSAELRRSLVLTEMAAPDLNRDGKLTSAELLRYIDQQRTSAGVHVHLVLFDRERDLFALLDANGDGQLSQRELLSAPQQGRTADANGDGLLSPAEIPSRWAVEVALGPEGYGEVSPDARTVRKPAASDLLQPVWFRQMDRNHDGDVSRREFLGPAAVFDAADRDHDGLLSPGEAGGIPQR